MKQVNNADNLMHKNLSHFMWHFLSQYKKYLVIPVIFACTLAIENSLTPYLLKVIVDRLINLKPSDSVLYALAVPAGLYVSMREIVNWAFRLHDWFKIKVVAKIKIDTAEYMLDQIKKHSYNFFQNTSTGTLVQKISDMVLGIETLISMIAMIFMWRLLVINVSFIFMYQVHPDFTILVFIWAIIVLTITLKSAKKSTQYSEQYSQIRSELMGRYSDFILNIINTKLFPNESFEKNRIKPYLHKVVQKERNLLWHLFKLSYLQGISITILVSGLMFLLIQKYRVHEITIGDFVLILGLSGTIIPMIFTLSDQLLQFFKEIGRCKQALKIISLPYEIVDNSDAKPLLIDKGEIVFDSVSFAYNDNVPLLKNFNLTISAGQKVGLIGYSGAGKTTLLNLILRLFDVTSGSISIDSQNIKQVTHDSLCSQVTVIPQEPILFNRSIMDNICYGDTLASEEQVIQAAIQANCHDFIKLLKNGYNTIVGERGLKLSSGQKQRIVIARAILKNAPIIIMDEATSALDSVTDQYIQKSLSILTENKTTIIVAHKLATLSSVDRIILLDKGKIVEDGTFSHLEKSSSLFQKFLKAQKIQ